MKWYDGFIVLIIVAILFMTFSMAHTVVVEAKQRQECCELMRSCENC